MIIDAPKIFFTNQITETEIKVFMTYLFKHTLNNEDNRLHKNILNMQYSAYIYQNAPHSSYFYIK